MGVEAYSAKASFSSVAGEASSIGAISSTGAPSSAGSGTETSCGAAFSGFPQRQAEFPSWQDTSSFRASLAFTFFS